MHSSFDNAHSRLVAWLKVLLPLTALGLLSTLFLLSNRVDPDAAIPYAEVDVQQMAREPRLTRPEFSGMTLDGAAISLRAAEARPGAGVTTGASATNLVGRIDLPDGSRADLSANQARIDPENGQIELSSGVAITTSQGYVLNTSLMQADTNQTHLVAPGAVSGVAPMGKLNAGSMELSTTGPDHSQLLVFKDGVKLIYRP
jgi:lipopolysaccharide export system protein LptC